MQITKQCAICGHKQNYNSKYAVAKFAEPNSLEEKYLFELWHKPALVCSNCGYASFDTSVCKDRGILNDKQFLSVNSNGVVNKIEEFKRTKLGDYLKCGSYYNLIGDNFNEGISYLLASEEVNLAIIHYMREVSEDVIGGEPDIVEKKLDKYAEMLFDYGLSRLELLYDENKYNPDLNILFGGLLISGDENQLQQGKLVLAKTLNMLLKPIQKKTCEFLLEKANSTNLNFDDEE